MKRLAWFVIVIWVVTTVAVALPPSPVAPVEAQDSGWVAYYYENPYMLGEPKGQDHVGRLEFNWGGNAPLPDMVTDNWSARFATDTYFSAGTYRFYVMADDGVALRVSYSWGQRAEVDTFDSPRVGELMTVDVTLTEGMRHIQVDFREAEGDAYLYVGWENLADGASGPSFPQPVFPVSQWTAQYYNNTELSGVPVLTRAEDSPFKSWGTDAPAPGVNVDFWSARWTAMLNLEGGTYTATVYADDGVRVLINGQAVINEWHYAYGTSYSGQITLPAGQYSVSVEFFDLTLNASVSFAMTRQATGTPPTTGIPTSPTGALATVTAWRLNVRNAPITGQVIGKISQNETYPVLGRNAASTWWLINVNSLIGWVSGSYVTVTNAQNVPVTNAGGTVVQPTAQPTLTPVPTAVTVGQCPGFLASRLVVGQYGQVLPGLPNNMRVQPSLAAAAVGQIPAGGVFYVQGGPVCNDSAAWWQVNYFGVVGWTMEGQYGVYWLKPYP